MSCPRSGIQAARSARLNTVGRRRRRWAAKAVRPAGLHVRPRRAIDCWPTNAIGAPWAVRPVRSVGTIGPVRPPRPVGSVIAIAPVVFAPGAVAIVVRVDTCAERRGAKKKRQCASEPGHVCNFLAVSQTRGGLHRQHCGCIARANGSWNLQCHQAERRVTSRLSRLASATGGASRHFGVGTRGTEFSRRSGVGPSMRRICR